MKTHSSLFDLAGRVAVIAGASSGLGADAARAYVLYGADVVLLARRKEKLEQVAAELRQSGRNVLALSCDVSREEEVKSAVETAIDRFGKIDILFNNAGIAIPGTVEQLSEADWDRGMNINLKGMYLTSKYIIPHMKQRRYGKIVNTASVNAIIADKQPVLARHLYNASKAGVRGLTIAMAASYGTDNITVNAIGPGLFESEMTAGTLFKNETFLQTYNALNPMGRPGRRGELNGTILYLSSEASSYVTGQYIVVDGGASIV